MVTRSLVQSAIHTAATSLAQLPQGEWTGWIIYLCETLELVVRNKHAADFDTVIRDLITRLEKRLERGKW